MNRKWQECSVPSGVSGMAGAAQENRDPVDVLVILSECLHSRPVCSFLYADLKGRFCLKCVFFPKTCQPTG